MFRLAYNTNGLAHHRLLDALRLLAVLGYEGVAITPDAGQLDPLDPSPRLVEDVRRWSGELGLELAVETGARYLLDPFRKHWPTLLDPDPEQRLRRVRFLERSIDLAAELDAGVVSLWSGADPGGAVADRRGGPAAPEEVWQRLVDGLRPVLEHGAKLGVRVAFEPEPGMFVERPAGFLELVQRLGNDGDELGLCLDVGHCVVTGDLPVSEHVRALAPRLCHVHLDDCPAGVHEHQMFGHGVLNLPDVLNSLMEVGYDGLAAVELSRDSHRGAWAAQESLRLLKAALGAPH